VWQLVQGLAVAVVGLEVGLEEVALLLAWANLRHKRSNLLRNGNWHCQIRRHNLLQGNSRSGTHHCQLDRLLHPNRNKEEAREG